MGERLSVASSQTEGVVTRSRAIARERDAALKRLQVVEAESKALRKRMRREKSICSCSSSPSAFLTAHSFSFLWYQEDVWTEIAKFLDAKSLIMLALTSRWFHRLITEDNIWKHVFLRDLQVPAPQPVTFKWIKLYGSAVGKDQVTKSLSFVYKDDLEDGSHSYVFRQPEKHIDWMRIGAFFLDSSVTILSERLCPPKKIPKEDSIEKMLQFCGCFVLQNIKSGIWIADLQLVRCPVCDLHTCDGTMQTLDARHIELFLNEGYQNGSWEYQLLCSHDIKKPTDAASGAIFDSKHLRDSSTFGIFDLKSWAGNRNDWQPKAIITPHAVAVNTNLQNNEGIHVKYHAMRAGADGEVVSIRISQQLL